MAELISTRLKELMANERHELDAVLDSTYVAHIAFVENGSPMVMATAVARWGDQLLAHGSTGSRWMRIIAGGAEATVSIAHVHGLLVSRNGYDSGVLYRSAMVFGSFSRVEGPEKEEALNVLVERLMPGRSAEIRRPHQRELAATMVLSMPLDTWSVRVLDQMPEDPDDDVAGDAWAGLVRFGDVPGIATGSPDLRAGIEVPPSLAQYEPR